MSGGRRRFPRLFGPDPVADVDDEIAFHLEMRIRDRVAAGEDPDRARAAVLARFGDVEAARTECVLIDERRGRRMKRADHVREFGSDVAYAVRTLRRRPGFALLAIVTLGLGIGANSAIFSVVNGVLLEPLPYTDAAQLFMVQTEYSDGGAYPLSAPDFMSVREENRVFADVSAVTSQRVTLTGRGEPAEVVATLVSRGALAMLGLSPQAGRSFTDDEHEPGAARAALLTEAFARRYFGTAAAALNETITLQGNAFTVVGVMTAGTETPEQAQLYLPLAYDSTFSAQTALSRRGEFLSVVARARPDATPATVLADVRRIGADLQERFAATNGSVTFTVRPLRDVLLGDVRRPLLVLLGAVGLVLLVACANVANLLLARASVREGELAVRAALGAGRARLVRQLLTESTVLAGAGAVLGLALAWLGTRALVASRPVDLPRMGDIGIDGRVLLFTAGIALVTGLLFGTLPALQATGGRMMRSLRESGRGTQSSVRGQRIRAGLVAAELALAVMLLVGAGLLIRSFVAMTRVDAGFEMEGAVSFRVSLPGAAWAEPETRRRFFAQLQEELAALPGVTHVGAATGLPMTDNVSLLGPFQVEGADVPANVLPEMRVVRVTPTYFAALGTPLLGGRMLDERDDADAPLVVLFNRAAIGRWFPDGDPVGERILLGGTPREVVGVVGDVLQGAPNAPVEPEMYMPYAQSTGRSLALVVRGRGDMTALAPDIRRTVHALDAQLPVESIDPLTTVFSDAVARPRFFTLLLTLFAGLALVLAVVGIFGVMSFLVAQRAHEISIRMALGADRGRVIAMVVGSALRVAAIGLAAGLALALALGGVVRSQLFGVQPADPVTIAAVIVLLGGSAALASFIPARRAARMQPAAALREG